MHPEYAKSYPARNSSGARHAAVIPSDSTDLPVRPRALYVGTGGDLALRDAAGVVAIRRNVAAGTEIAFEAVRVMATGTTASDILAIW
ncbi:hypothetical protein PSM7751_01402 [Pseudooceanicola marinus]|uniref:Uncharacterized protein n=1 Tax=Pseudooceanicola marinus TaxID=396013 RepID=A0A1X6YWY2_9RHOB|nr:hypothetical protein [Pseudooceanicola marinus]PJE32676.1 hypothetical protein CVM50_07215 [Pseudooceanicola marinus]SLN34074.1 hypothetical protein PSM7751_01402 [Pseudooceanicola marinus]